MSLNGGGNGGWLKVALALVGILQALIIAGILYWSGRVDANTASNAGNAHEIGQIQGSLEQISKQLDRIEVRLRQRGGGGLNGTE